MIGAKILTPRGTFRGSATGCPLSIDEFRSTTSSLEQYAAGDPWRADTVAMARLRSGV